LISLQTILTKGTQAVAQAVKNARVDVVAAYPITPQTAIVEALSSMIEKGEMDGRFLPVEGEHSTMAACAAASAMGARTFTATASQGLLYMHEVLHMVSGCRFPVVMANVNRAVFAPWTLWVDHQDSLAQRDTGWIQYYCSSLQETYNTLIQAFRVAEDIKLPVMVNMDGFILSHCTTTVNILEQETVDQFLPPFEPEWKLDPQNPTAYASVTPSYEYSQFRALLAQDGQKAKEVIVSAAREYQELTGMWDGDLLDFYRCEDAEVFVLAMGSMASELRLAADILHQQGIKAGVIRLRVYRPFPEEALAAALPDGTTLIVLDRDYDFGLHGGILYSECKASLYDRGAKIRVKNAVMGIGGLDVTYQEMAAKIKSLLVV